MSKVSLGGNMKLSWTEVEGGLEYPPSVEESERILNHIRVIDLGGRLKELEEDTPSWGMYWLLASARSEVEKANWSECLAWLYKAKCLAWYKLSVLDKITECIDLIYKIDQNVLSYYWERLPAVEEKGRILAGVLPLIGPDVEEAAKRTRIFSLRFYLGKRFFRSSPVEQLDYLLCAEFISAHFSTVRVRTLVQRALLEVLGGMYEYGG